MPKPSFPYRTIAASPRSIFRAFLNPALRARWHISMLATADALMAEKGSRQRTGAMETLSLGTFGDTGVIRSRYIELQPHKRIVETVELWENQTASGDLVRIITTLSPVRVGTKISVATDGTAPTLDIDKFCTSLNASLKRLADLLE